MQAQNRSLKGTVSDEQGNPMIGVSITVAGSNNATVSDTNGKYSLTIPDKAIVKFSYLGYKPQAVNIKGDKPVLDIVLEEDVIALQETVVYAMDMRRDEKSISTALQKVDTESMTESRDGNFLNMLAGKVANLQVISNGAPGTSTRVVLRGENSITGNNQPLYVIDGIPIINEMGEYGDMDYGNPANSINPDDIEGLTVLKGANAAALYGSDAANGVILITTKKASKKNGLGISVSSNLQFNQLMQYPIYQNVYGVGSGGRLNEDYNFYNSNKITYDPSKPWGIVLLTGRDYNQRSFGAPMLGFDVVGRNGEIKTYSPHPDNVISMYKSGHIWTNNVAFDKLTDVVSVRFSYSNAKTDDILNNFNILDRNSFSLRTTSKIAEFLSVDVNARYNNEKATNRGFRNASDKNPLYRMAWMPRDISKEEMTPWKKPDGKSVIFPGGFYNPYWLLNELSNEDKKHWLLIDAGLNFNITKDIKLRLKGSIDMNVAQGWTFTNMYAPFGDTDGDFQSFSEIYRSDVLEALLSYNKKWKDFNLSASAGAWGQSYERKKEIGRVETLLQPDDKSLANNGGVARAWEDYNAKKKQAVFGTTSLGYKDFLYLDITGRNDWSSSLPAKNRSYFYSSSGVSFVLTEAVKIPKNVLSYAKFRASIATVGNDTGFDMLLDGYAYGNIYLGDMPWYQSDNLKKKLMLKPEQTTSSEIGTDLRFWNNRINIDATYYSKSTKDQILQSRVSVASGYENAMYNAGEVRNWGTELSLRIVPVKTKEIEWTSIFNWAKNHSKIVSLANDMESMTISRHNNTEIRAVVGRSYGTLYGSDWKRDEEGRVMVDANGRNIEEKGLFLGDVSPDWIGGWGNSFKIKNIDVSFLFSFKKGGLLWSATATQGSRDGQTLESLVGRDEHLFSHWVLGENDQERKGYLQQAHTVNPQANLTDNTVPYYDSDRLSGIKIPNAYFDESVPDLAGRPSYINVNPQDFWSTEKNGHLFLYDASFIKLREVSIGYNFPKSLLKHTPFFRSVKLSAVGRNLAILYQKTPKGLDPEATTSMGNGQGVENGFNLPSMTYGFDLKVTF
jgi:TonB-linked SusC/RagA family outer membrane protein